MDLWVWGEATLTMHAKQQWTSYVHFHHFFTIPPCLCHKNWALMNIFVDFPSFRALSAALCALCARSVRSVRALAGTSTGARPSWNPTPKKHPNWNHIPRQNTYAKGKISDFFWLFFNKFTAIFQKHNLENRCSTSAR